VRVHVRLFASLRESAGVASLDLDVPEGATLEDVWAALVTSRPALETRRSGLSAALDRRLATFATVVPAESEVAFLPPVSGG
jgi:molybdopterin converting factor subunit 1